MSLQSLGFRDWTWCVMRPPRQSEIQSQTPRRRRRKELLEFDHTGFKNTNGLWIAERKRLLRNRMKSIQIISFYSSKSHRIDRYPQTLPSRLSDTSHREIPNHPTLDIDTDKGLPLRHCIYDNLWFWHASNNESVLSFHWVRQNLKRVSQSPDRQLETGFSFQHTHKQIFEDGIQFTSICGVSIEYQL